MISGWPVFWVLLLAATGAALVLVATPAASADSAGAGGAAPAAGLARDRELAATAPAAATIVERETSEVFRVPSRFRTGSESAIGAARSDLSSSRSEQDLIQSTTGGRRRSRSLISGSLQQAELEAKHPPVALVAPASAKVYTNQFVIQVKGGELEARKLAQKHGFVYLNHILDDYYHLEHRRLSKRSTSPHQDALNISIQDEPQVLLLERQILKRRVKRDFLEFPTTPATAFDPAPATAFDPAPTGGRAGPGPSHQAAPIRPANQQRPAQQLLRPNSSSSGQRKPHPQQTRPANQPRGPLHRPQQPATATTTSATAEASGTGRSSTQELLEAAASSASLLYQHAVAAGGAAPKQLGGGARPSGGQPTAGATTSNGAGSGFAQLAQAGNSSLSQATRPPTIGTNGSRHMPFNDPSWPLMWYLDGGAKNGFDLNVMAAWRMGYTGKGIVITILDDGLEKDHPDLQANYDPLASFDINGDDADPMPRYDVNDSNRHGTRCAGEVAAVPDNNICSIGIAYNSKVGGVRMLDGDVTDAVEARSLGLNNQHIHIYSASWGPDDNGKTVDGPGEMATRAFIEGVTNGRQGLGSIFVFASGNGGREHDNCNCDGYTNSIWTLSISSATENGYVPWYIEACSSTLATTYSSGSYEERQIATTDLHHSCTSSHTGTSASAPLAAGICALVLESNPRLTWRDMQHIVVRTAKPANLVAKDWRQNALKRNVSHAFGYGLMDAAAMIIMAKHWTTVPIQYTCEVRSPPMDKFIPAKGYIELKLRAECANVRYLEHVQSKVTLTASRRGDLHIYLISPHGTRSTLLAQRPNDQAEQGFRNWPFMTVHSWGESPNGVWTLEVHNDGKPQNRAYLKEWTLILYGTSEDPNKHLDAAALTQAAMSQTSGASLPAPTQPKVPAPIGAGLPPLSGESTSPPPPLPAVSSNPPAPLPPTPGQYPSVELKPAPPASRPSSHWTFPSPAPPLPPPVSAPGRPSVTPQPSAPSTTPTSYVTTFKTIVNTNDSPTTSSVAPLNTQILTANSGRIHSQHQQQSQTQHQPSAGVQQQTGKADFEIVSPATQAPPHTSHNLSQPATTTTATTTTTTTSTNSPTTLADGLQPHDAGITKPSVSQLDTSPAQHQQSAGGINQAKPNELPSGQQQQPPPSGTNELDGNQIDLKLTKDYRSSGDQSATMYAHPTQLVNHNDRLAGSNGHALNRPGADGSDQQPPQPPPPGSAASSPSINQSLVSAWAWPLITLLTTLIISNYHPPHHGRLTSSDPRLVRS